MNGYLRVSRKPRGACATSTLTIALALLTAACSGNLPAGSAASAPAPPGALIDQPEPPSNLKVAPESDRVDLVMPTFSDPTTITNPLFPVSSLHSVVMVGEVDGQAFRTEITLLPTTRVMTWEGLSVETAVSQYMAYLDGRLTEVAYDLYAQADDGSVWYFGEDVFNFSSGAIVNTHGSWLAGVDGPAAMIMPADPQVGDVYRPENIPGLVFEEVTVTEVDQAFDGPFGPVEGGITISELHMDGGTEGKQFAPGYGEFYTDAGGDIEALALAVPTDASTDPVPAELETLATQAATLFDAVMADDWEAASVALDQMVAAWEAFPAGEIPVLIEPVMADALDALASAVDARDGAEAAQAVVGVGQSTFDLQLRYRPPAEIDLARAGLWSTRLMADATAEDAEGVNDDGMALDYIRDRIASAVSEASSSEINTLLEELHVAVGEDDFGAVADLAEQLRQAFAEAAPSA